MMTINELCKAAFENAKSKGFFAEEENIPEKFCLMHSEISEALEEFRSGRLINEVYTSEGGKPEGIGVELADCVIRIAHFCGRYGIDLEAMIELKMQYNAQRPFKHGKVC